MTTRTASWIETFTHKRLDFYDPDPANICIEDIAHHLANVNRFGGSIYMPYSVAQHSVIMSRICPPELALECLLHDAEEAYLGDIVRPFKSEQPNMAVAAARFEKAIRTALGMPGDTHPPEVKHWDNVMLNTEARDFKLDWYGSDKHDLPPAHEILVIEPWPWDVAKAEFLYEYKRLTS